VEIAKSLILMSLIWGFGIRFNVEFVELVERNLHWNAQEAIPSHSRCSEGAMEFLAEVLEGIQHKDENICRS
jgi:hypothetical protein